MSLVLDVSNLEYLLSFSSGRCSWKKSKQIVFKIRNSTSPNQCAKGQLKSEFNWPLPRTLVSELRSNIFLLRYILSILIGYCNSSKDKYFGLFIIWYPHLKSWIHEILLLTYLRLFYLAFWLFQWSFKSANPMQ